MTQSGIIAGVLLAGFLLFLAAKDRLNAYTAVLWGPTSNAPPNGGNSSSPVGGSPSAPMAPGGLSLPDIPSGAADALPTIAQYAPDILAAL